MGHFLLFNFILQSTFYNFFILFSFFLYLPFSLLYTKDEMRDE